MVSYIGLNPAQLGVVIPQEPLTGALRFDQAIAFDLLTQVSFQSQGAVARHPIQSGREGPSDSILEEPERCTISAVFVDKPLEIGFVINANFPAPDRCLGLATDLRNLKAKRQLLTMISASRESCFALSTLCCTPCLMRRSERYSLFATDTVPTSTGCHFSWRASMSLTI